MVHAESALRRSETIRHHRVGDEIVLLNVNTGFYYSLNDAGAFFWDLLDGKRTVGECAALLAERHRAGPAPVSPERALDDLLELCRDLLKEGMIEPA